MRFLTCAILCRLAIAIGNTTRKRIRDQKYDANHLQELLASYVRHTGINGSDLVLFSLLNYCVASFKLYEGKINKVNT